MGPNNNIPNFNKGGVSQPNNLGASHEQLPQYNVGGNTTHDSRKENLNLAPAIEQAPPAPLPLPVVTPVQSTATPVPPPTSQPDPVAAIPTTKQEIAKVEKEWVDKAKSTIASTRANPYEQAHQVSLLMKGYLQARYGKIIGGK